MEKYLVHTRTDEEYSSLLSMLGYPAPGTTWHSDDLIAARFKLGNNLAVEIIVTSGSVRPCIIYGITMHISRARERDYEVTYVTDRRLFINKSTKKKDSYTEADLFYEERK